MNRYQINFIFVLKKIYRGQVRKIFRSFSTCHFYAPQCNIVLKNMKAIMLRVSSRYFSLDFTYLLLFVHVYHWFCCRTSAYIPSLYVSFYMRFLIRIKYTSLFVFIRYSPVYITGPISISIYI